MELRVDWDICQGHGKCYLIAPDLFVPEDEWGRPLPTCPHIDPDDTELLKLAQLAVQNCPERAITLQPEPSHAITGG